MRPTAIPRLLPALLLASMLPAQAIDWSDPLASRAMLGSRVPACHESAVENLSLADAVNRALCSHPQTRSSWAAAQAQAAQLGVARAAQLPTLSANLSADRQYQGGFASNQSNTTSTGFSAGASLSYLLYDFGSRDAKEESARQVLNAALGSLDSTQQSVFLSAATAYFQVQGSESTIAATRAAEQNAEQNLKAATARHLAGTATPLDKLQAQTAYSQAQLNRIKAEGEARNQRATLANAMGLVPTTPFSLAATSPLQADDSFLQNVEKLIDAARQSRPDLAAAEAQVKAARANVQAARADEKPTISLFATPGITKNNPGSNSHSTTVGVQVSIPLFSGFAPTYRTQAAEMTLLGKEADRDNLAQQVALDVVKAHNTLNTSSQTLKTTQDLLKSATQAHAVAHGRYSAGVGTFLDLLDAQSKLDDARAQEIQARLNWQIARFTLAQALGQLKPDFLTSSRTVRTTP
ncbi:outer membrane protein [Formivibrio citricus]|uniref:Protein CyaE n=1 Tax=Formivibrio citricus TaxID=83765 RepID=A0A1I4Y7V5_9NEIS|nr:TolC family protein [Formivibrio citricus]SFN34117.1 outer membrane protein [Formivibrio citricus]